MQNDMEAKMSMKISLAVVKSCFNECIL